MTNLPRNVAYRVDGVHLYADILNLSEMLHVTDVEGETCHRRTLRFLNLHYRAVYRIIERVNAIFVDFHNQRLHSVVSKPYDAEAARVHKAVAIGQLIIDVLAQTGEDADHPAAKVRIGIDTGKALAVNNGRRGHREPLFLGVPANHAAYEIAAGDLNGDGRPDIVLTTFPNNEIYVLLNEPGGFEQSVINHATYSGYVTLGDVNGDGTLDMVVDVLDGPSVYLNNGSGQFGKPIKLSDPLSDGGFPVIADVSGDGIADVLFEGFAAAAIYLGEGGGKFASAIYEGTGNSATGLYALDLHGQNPKNGIPDLVEVDGTGVLYTLINETK